MKTEIFNEEGESRGFYSSNNRVNNLTGKEWLFWTRSVINKPYPPNCQHKLRNSHGGQKPPDLCRDLINIFTKEGDRVLDPFMGVGGTLLGAAKAGRKALGIELNAQWINIYKEVCRLEKLEELETLEGNSEEQLKKEIGPVDMILTDVPYWKMDTARRSTGKFKKTGEEAKENRLTKLSQFNEQTYPTKAEWLEKMKTILSLGADHLKDRGYMAVFVGDMYYENAYHSLSSELAAALSKVPNLLWKANLIWYDVSKKLHLYGYQYAFIPSMIHQNILIFRKELNVEEQIK